MSSTLTHHHIPYTQPHAPSHILTHPHISSTLTHPHTHTHPHTPLHTEFALAALLHSGGIRDATMTICHEHTPPDQLPVMTRTADILIVGTGLCVCIERGGGDLEPEHTVGVTLIN